MNQTLDDRNQSVEEKKEEFADSIVDQISDQVNNEFQASPDSFGFTNRDRNISTGKFCSAIVTEIDARVEAEVKERFD